MVSETRVVLAHNGHDDAGSLENALLEITSPRKVTGLAELQALLAEGSCDALFCTWLLHDGTWKDVLRLVQANCLAVPVIVFSRTGSEKEWVEVLEAGAFDLLVAPYQKVAIAAVLDEAIASSEARHKNDLVPVGMGKAS